MFVIIYSIFQKFILSQLLKFQLSLDIVPVVTDMFTFIFKILWFNDSINTIHHINKMDKNYIIFSMDAQKSIWQNSTPFMINTLNKVGIEEMYFNVIKAIHDTPTLHAILNSKNLTTSSTVMKKTWMSTLSALFST